MGSSTGESVKEIEYQTLVQNYGLPFNFSIVLHNISMDVDFMKEFLDMAIKKNEKDPIVLTYIESSSTTTTTKEYSGKISVTASETDNSSVEKGNYTIIYKGEDEKEEALKDVGVTIIDSSNVGKYYTPDYYKEIVTYNSGALYVTKADTWLKSTSKEISELQSPTTTGGSGDSTIVYNKSSKELIVVGPEEYIIKTKRTIIYEKTVITTESKRYTITDDDSKINVDEFIELIKKYPSVNENLQSAPEMIFEFLQKYENTQKIEKVMRYVLAMLTGNDYGVTTLEELEAILRDSYTYVRGSSTENYIKLWENSTLWSYETGQTSEIPTKYLTSDGLNYIVYEDGSNGHNNIAYGWATFITNEKNVKATHPIYGEGYYNWKEAFAAQGIDVTSLYEGGYVDKEKATIVFQNDILPTFIGIVDNYLDTNLAEYEFTQQQKDALTAIAYQYGNISGFADAYKNSLNSDGSIDANKLKNNYSRFKYTSTINDRRYANWLLFTQGIYIDRAGNEVKLGCSIVDAAYAVADHFLNSGVDIHYAGNSVEGANDNNRYVISGNILASWEKPIENPEHYGVVCATFVSLSIWHAGLIDEDTINQYNYNSCQGVNTMLTESEYADEWEIIYSWDDLQEGDIVWIDGHVFIYMDGGKCLDQGYCVISSHNTDHRGNLTDASQYRSKFIKGFRYIGR